MVAYLPSTHKATGSMPAPYKLGVVSYACNSGSWTLETKGPKVQGHPWLPTEFETRMGYERHLAQTNTQTAKGEADAALCCVQSLEREIQATPWPLDVSVWEL